MGTTRSAIRLAGLTLAVALATAACESGGPAETAVDPSAASPTAAPSTVTGRGEATGRPTGGRSTGSEPSAREPTSEEPTAQETRSPDVIPVEYRVDEPGPRQGPLRTPDILAVGADTWSDDVVQRLRDLEGVEDVVRLSLVQVPVEGRSLAVAAVDPGTYRNYTQLASADLQAMWDRIAGGEIAVLPELEKELPLDEEEFLTLDGADGAVRIHVGAYAPQIPQVDAVVNHRWGEALGAPAGNAVLISTGTLAPQELRPTVQRILGEGTSVQLGDAMTQYGLDPSVRQTAVVVGSAASVVGTYRYGVGPGNQVIPDPGWVSANIRTEDVPILGRITCHKDLFPQLRAALTEVVEEGLADAIHPEQYAGCFHPRFIAGTTSLSNHSYGLALDVNVPGNQRGTVGEIDRHVVGIFKRWGFAWGGDWRWTDPMHFEMAEHVTPDSD